MKDAGGVPTKIIDNTTSVRGPALVRIAVEFVFDCQRPSDLIPYLGTWSAALDAAADAAADEWGGEMSATWPPGYENEFTYEGRVVSVTAEDLEQAAPQAGAAAGSGEA